MTIVCKAKLQNNEEQQIVNELTQIALDAGIVQTLIRRQPTSFGARAKPYKVCTRNGVITLDINLGVKKFWLPAQIQNTKDKVKSFVKSDRVQKYIEETV